MQPRLARGREHVGETGEHEGQLQAGGPVVAGGRGVPGVRRSAGRVVGATRSPHHRAGSARWRLDRRHRPRGPRAARARHPARPSATRPRSRPGRPGRAAPSGRRPGPVVGSLTGVAHPAARHRHGVQPEDGLGDDGQGAERADEQLAEVVARDVLDHPAAGLRDHPVGAHHGDADQQVAGGARGDATCTARVGGQRPPDARARDGLVERKTLATATHDLLEISETRAGLGDHDQVTGRVLDDLVERAHVEQHVGAGGRHSPTTAWCHVRGVRR